MRTAFGFLFLSMLSSTYNTYCPEGFCAQKPSGLFIHSTLYTRPPKIISKEAEWHEKRETLKGSGRYVHVEQIKLTLFGMNHNRPRNRFPHVYHDRVAARINGMLSRSGSTQDNVQRGIIIRMQNLIHGGGGICGSFIENCLYELFSVLISLLFIIIYKNQNFLSR